MNRAKEEDKPIFLSIGYAACHWCHVMEHESFEDDQIASVMNEHFINIKVDREERPDLDNIYMKAVVALTGQGGWPMSVFLTPEGRPFYGGTYFPPVRRYNMPSFRDVLLRMAELWQEERERVQDIGEDLLKHLQAEFTAGVGAAEGLDRHVLDQAALALAQSYDWKEGGWGKAPKFPQSMAISFLAQRVRQGDGMAKDMIQHALSAMGRGGIFDVIGGGFHRYSVDDQWLVPHFEKMLYDNAQLSLAYLQGYLLTGDEAHRRTCEQTIDFVLRELRHPEGGFYSSLDADSEGEEGLYYVWTADELRDVLQDKADIDLFFTAYGITEGGNFEGRTVLQQVVPDEKLAEQFDGEEAKIRKRLDILHQNLREVRSDRERPATDDKVLTSWNGLMLWSLSEAARYLGREDYRQAAVKNARFLLKKLLDGDRLLRSWRDGEARHNAYLEDHGALCLGLLSLYMTDPNPRWFQAGRDLASAMVSHYWISGEGFFDTRHDHEQLVVRPRDAQDNATPSGGALATHALLRISALDGNGEWRDVAQESLRMIKAYLPRYPTAFAHWLTALDFALGDVIEVAVLGSQDSERWQRLNDAVWETYQPHLVFAADDHPPDPRSPALLKDRALVDHQPTAYVCRKFACRQPVNQAEALRHQLAEERSEP